MANGIPIPSDELTKARMIEWHAQELEREFRKTMVLAQAIFASAPEASISTRNAYQTVVSEYIETIFPTKERTKQKAENLREKLENEARKIYEVVMPEEHQ